jgi:cyclic pyranopterin phosphate synthase
MLTDTFNRVHDYLRISITDNCNLRCFYCMPEENYIHTPSSRMMQADEIEKLAGIFVTLGVKKIRLTGGEPLLRKDAGRIITSLSQLPVELTLTTNGSRLPEFLDVLKKASVRSINISLDTLKAETFNIITRRDQHARVMDYIHLAIDSGLRIKINVVVMKGLNDTELNDFISWTKHTPVHVRFIEFMPFSGNRWTGNKVFTWQQMLQVISQQYSFVPIQGGKHDTDKKYMIPGHAGTFAVISPMSAPFCGDCNRMRLTADGKMKNCLFSTGETDLLTPLRKGEDVVALIRQSVHQKAEKLGGQFSDGFEMIKAGNLKNRSMITIGG